MQESKFNQDLISYAISYVSFVLPKINNINEIILFGSVARNEADKKSDIDLFFDIKEKKYEINTKKICEDELKKFYKSKYHESWKLLGINNPINITVGLLSEWKLKRSIISEGITLFGKYKELPGNIKKYYYFNLEPIQKISKRNKIIRRLFGRKEDKYDKKGIIGDIKKNKLTPTSFILSVNELNEVIKYLGSEKVNYRFFEFWSDQFDPISLLTPK